MDDAEHSIRTVMVTTRDSQIITLWLQKQASSHTRSCYRLDSRRLLNHAKKSLARITLADLQSFAQSLIKSGLAPVSRLRTIAAVKSLFGFCSRMRYLPTNPAAELALPSYEKRLAERIVSEEDVTRMLHAEAGPRDRVLVRLLYGAGLRVSEACQLRWRNLCPRGDAGQITVFGKSGRTRSVPLPALLWSELIALRDKAGKEDPVFPSRTGRSLDRGRVRMIVRRAAKQVSIADAVSPHWLRHSHASHALDHGAPIHLLRSTLGHRSLATTCEYLHARPGDSSARFLTLAKCSPESSRIRLPLGPTEVMNMSTANHERQRRNMATFTIDLDKNISAFAGLPAGADESQSFSTEKELAKLTAEWPASRLLDAWNSFAGVAPFDELKPVKKFTDRKAAVARIWAAIQRLSPDVAPPATHVATERTRSKKSPAKGSRRARAQKGATESRTNKTISGSASGYLGCTFLVDYS
jgi:site-specific recombinase XerD